MRSRKYAAFAAMLLLSAILASACANMSSPGKASTNPNLTTHSYGNDGYQGLTNTNPSVPLTPTSLNEATDGRMVRDILAEYKDVIGSTVQFQGGTANVWVTLSNRLNAAEKRTLQVDLYRKLSHMMPRYSVKVISR